MIKKGDKLYVKFEQEHTYSDDDDVEHIVIVPEGALITVDGIVDNETEDTIIFSYGGHDGLCGPSEDFAPLSG